MNKLLKNFVLVSAVALTSSVIASDLAIKAARDYEQAWKDLADDAAEFRALTEAQLLADPNGANAKLDRLEYIINALITNKDRLEAFKESVTGGKAGQLGVTRREAFRKAIGKNIGAWLEAQAAERARWAASIGNAGKDLAEILNVFRGRVVRRVQAAAEESERSSRDWYIYAQELKAELKDSEDKWEQAVKDKMSCEMDLQAAQDQIAQYQQAFRVLETGLAAGAVADYRKAVVDQITVLRLLNLL